MIVLYLQTCILLLEATCDFPCQFSSRHRLSVIRTSRPASHKMRDLESRGDNENVIKEKFILIITLQENDLI